MTTAKKKVNRTVQGNDATIKVNMFLPEMEPIEHVFKITNLKGRATNSQRTPKAMINAIALGLMSKYGKKLE